MSIESNRSVSGVNRVKTVNGVNKVEWVGAVTNPSSEHIILLASFKFGDN